MLALTSIAALSATLDPRWCSPVADAIAARWGLPAGDARFWRSSASHVFVSSLGYLRFAPAAPNAFRVAALEAELASLGYPIAAPVVSASGMLTETVTTPIGVMVASLHVRALGEPIDDPDPRRARLWGAALARLHTTRVTVPLPTAALAADPALAHLPRDPTRFGLTHGDFELDNIAWNGDTPTVYDFDEAGWSWFAADIAFALRDLTGGTGIPLPEHVPCYEAFLAGYRDIHPFDDEALLPLLSRRLAAHAARRVAVALDSPDPPELRQRLESFIARQTQLAAREERSSEIGQPGQ